MNSKAGGVRYLTVDERGEGQRIDNFLLRELKGVPRTLVYRLLRRGEVRVNKGRAKAGRRLQAGDVVRIPPLRMDAVSKSKGPAGHFLEIIEKTVIYEDKLLLILNKPPGLAVHGGSGLSHGVIELLRAARPGERALELAHRLDRDTSGCLMVARRRSALRTLHQLQREGKVQKRYLALLHGRWDGDRARVTAPLEKNRLQGGERMVRVSREGKPARTDFRVVRRFQEATLVEATLGSGRTHQIRVHAAHLGTPILGDTKYGDEAANRRFRELGLKRLFLHASSLRLPWPDRPQPYHFEAPLPGELERLLERLDD